MSQREQNIRRKGKFRRRDDEEAIDQESKKSRKIPRRDYEEAIDQERQESMSTMHQIRMWNKNLQISSYGIFSEQVVNW